MTIIVVSTENQIAVIETLAREIWTEYYIPIIGKDQVEYMLSRFQSKQAVEQQIASGVLYFLLEECKEFVGYIAVHPRDNDLFLSKIYVQTSHRSKGFGKKAVQFAEALARERGLRKIMLTVNKNNTDAIRAYEKMGFKKAGSLVQDIGSGFVMDDYALEKTV